MCNEYESSAPTLYAMYCKGSGGSTKPVGSTSTFTDSFKLNAASLPTEDSPYGIEAISTFLTSGAPPGIPNLAIIKGFHRFGTGISTASSNTFYSNDLYGRLTGPSKLTTLTPHEVSRGYFTNLNLGTSFSLLDLGLGLRVQVGFSARYNKITNTIGGGPAVLLASPYFTLGLGVSREKTSNYLLRSDFVSFMASTRIYILELEFNLLSNNSVPMLNSISIFSGNIAFSNLIFTGAVRQLNYLSEGNVTQFHAGVQYLLSRHVSLGYLYNYIPGGNSLGLQIFL